MERAAAWAIRLLLPIMNVVKSIGIIKVEIPICDIEGFSADGTVFESVVGKGALLFFENIQAVRIHMIQ